MAGNSSVYYLRQERSESNLKQWQNWSVDINYVVEQFNDVVNNLVERLNLAEMSIDALMVKIDNSSINYVKLQYNEISIQSSSKSIYSVPCGVFSNYTDSDNNIVYVYANISAPGLYFDDNELELSYNKGIIDKVNNTFTPTSAITYTNTANTVNTSDTTNTVNGISPHIRRVANNMVGGYTDVWGTTNNVNGNESGLATSLTINLPLVTDELVKDEGKGWGWGEGGGGVITYHYLTINFVNYRSGTSSEPQTSHITKKLNMSVSYYKFTEDDFPSINESYETDSSTYEFNGWYSNQNKNAGYEITVGTEVYIGSGTEDTTITVYAIYDEFRKNAYSDTTYYIYWNYHNGDYIKNQVEEINLTSSELEDRQYILPSNKIKTTDASFGLMDKTYEFDNWNSNSDGSGNEYEFDDNNMIIPLPTDTKKIYIYAIYKSTDNEVFSNEESYKTIVWSYNGGTDSDGNTYKYETVRTGSTISRNDAPQSITKKNASFIRWINDSGETLTTNNVTINDNITFTALWEEPIYFPFMSFSGSYAGTVHTIKTNNANKIKGDIKLYFSLSPYLFSLEDSTITASLKINVQYAPVTTKSLYTIEKSALEKAMVSSTPIVSEIMPVQKYAVSYGQFSSTKTIANIANNKINKKLQL